MIKYIAFLRGININGRNKVSMKELKELFEKHGFKDVKTYLNSGNVSFSSSQNNIDLLRNHLEQLLMEKFSFLIPVYVISQEQLKDILQHAPSWWGNETSEIYDNLIFIIKPTSFQEVYTEIGNPKEDLEQILNYKETIFWSFSRKDYQKTNWWSKTAKVDIGKKLTIRTAKTVRTICEF